jgi:hypothetical protein
MTLMATMRCSLLVLATAVVATARPGAAELNDYPTDARADYIFACMKTNGESRQGLGAVFLLDRRYCVHPSLRPLCLGRNSPEPVAGPGPCSSRRNDLRRAQAEARVRCF